MDLNTTSTPRSRISPKFCWKLVSFPLTLDYWWRNRFKSFGSCHHPTKKKKTREKRFENSCIYKKNVTINFFTVNLNSKKAKATKPPRCTLHLKGLVFPFSCSTIRRQAERIDREEAQGTVSHFSAAAKTDAADFSAAVTAAWKLFKSWVFWQILWAGEFVHTDTPDNSVRRMLAL